MSALHHFDHLCLRNQQSVQVKGFDPFGGPSPNDRFLRKAVAPDPISGVRRRGRSLEAPVRGALRALLFNQAARGI
jgi:hypothetical protein